MTFMERSFLVARKTSLAGQALRASRHFHHAPPPTRPRLHATPRLSKIPFASRRTFIKGPPGSFFANAKTLFKHYPIHITIATASILLGAFGIIYVNWLYQSYIVGAFHNFPEDVAKPLRRALYYTNYDLQPQEALKYYKQALLTAEEVKMNPFSDEVLGIRIQLAAFLEKIQQPSKAIQVLERVRIDNLRWLELYGDRSELKIDRTRILAKTIAVSVKLGELYADPLVWDRETAEERLVWAVETALKERQRRSSLKVTEAEEGPWMDDESLGAAIESLAHRYEESDQHYLATPLFLQALNLYPTRDCHSVVLMNNLASSLAQQSPRAARAAQEHAASQTISDQPPSPTATKESMLQNAKTWAEKAIEIAAVIKPPERTEECDVGCAVALHNLAEFAEMSEDLATARSKYREAISLSKAIGFAEGVKMSTERLKALGKVAKEAR